VVGKEKPDKDFREILLWAVLFTAILSAVAYEVIVDQYERESHKDSSYVSSDIYRSALLKVDNLCGLSGEEGSANPEKCKEAIKLVSSLATFSDLRAQQTMATATRGILVATLFQIVVGIGTLALLLITVLQSREAARAATKILSQTEKTSALELKPYVQIAFDGIRFDHRPHDGPDNEIFFILAIRVTNYGKTPMERVIAWLEPSDFFVNVEDESRLAVDVLKGTRFTDSEVDIIAPTDESGIRMDIMGRASAANAVNVDAILSGEMKAFSVQCSSFYLRYKDISCSEKDWHVLARGRITEDPYIPANDVHGTRIYRFGKDEDSNHPRYS